jgi:hypothetical protein
VPTAPDPWTCITLVTADVGLNFTTSWAIARMTLHPTITKAWADTAYRTKVIDHAATLGIDLEPVRRDPATKGFVPLPRPWRGT